MSPDRAPAFDGPGGPGGGSGAGRTAHPPERPSLSIAAGGGYAARLVGGPGGRYPERWTLEGPEPYAVPLPRDTPEEPGTQVAPLADGRVLIARPEGDHYDLALLYPSGPHTGQLLLGSVETRRLRLLPPAPDGQRVYALAVPPDQDVPLAGRPDAGPVPRPWHAPPGADTVTEVWLVCGGAFGPELVAEVPGAASGGAWLDHEGLLLGLDRTDPSGRTRALTVPVDGSGDPAVLLQIGEESNDRLLLADPDSGLLLVASDAPGSERIGWGVLDSHRPVRFPDALCPPDAAVTPLAIQPGQMLLPEACGVALRLSGPHEERIAVWRPQQRGLQYVSTPDGWLPGSAQWTEDGELLLPRSTESAPCGLARIPVPVPALRPLRPGRHTLPARDAVARDEESGTVPLAGGASRWDALGGSESTTWGGAEAGVAPTDGDGATSGDGERGQRSGDVPVADRSATAEAADAVALAPAGRTVTTWPGGGAVCRPVPLHRAPQARRH